MLWEMFFGMSEALGRLTAPWSYLANLLLLLQFVVSHSFFLTRRGLAVMRWLGPPAIAEAMLSTTYVIVASLQTLALFVLWSPSGIVWWRADGPVLYLMLALYLVSGLVLLKAIIDAGLALQTGFLGWWAVATGRKPVYPPMPVTGLFRWVRQPIYLGFALTTWTVGVWTPDQLVLAVLLTSYCVAGPILKERRFRARFGADFERYRETTPYFMPRITSRISPRRRGS
jgi:protein-S-isoprenylcysteine O-methyltransferase Ste14